MEVRRNVAQESTFGRMINGRSAYHQGPTNSGTAQELEASQGCSWIITHLHILGNDCGGFVMSDNVDEFALLNLGAM